MSNESAMAPTRIGVLGGSYNPVHVGHLILAQDACELLELSKILLVPCAKPPHKPASDLVQGAHRMAMLEGAIEGDWRMEVSDLELRRGGVSYTVDTVRELKRLYPSAEIVLIIGADMLPDLHLWRGVDELFRLCRFAPFRRPGVDVEKCRPNAGRLGRAWAEALMSELREAHAVGVSSSEIRRRVAEGLSIRYLVHPAVEMYIAEHRLYRGSQPTGINNGG